VAVTSSVLDGILTNNNALYNGVLSGTSTLSSYSTLIGDHSGTVFNLNAFNTNDLSIITAFVTDFANRKLQETLTFCQVNPTDPACVNVTIPVPEPATLGLLSLALGGLVVRRRLNKSKATS
jgi:hypothetical protein